MSSRALRRLQKEELKNKPPSSGLNEELNENDGVEEVEEASNVIYSVKKKKKQKQKRINMFHLVS